MPVCKHGPTVRGLVPQGKAACFSWRSFTAVVCSTDFDYNTLAPDEVELPSDAAGKCSTELKKRTVAVCDWTAEFDVDEIIKQPDDITGIVHTVLLKEICEKAGITLPTER
jgi:hypothetical protein